VLGKMWKKEKSPTLLVKVENSTTTLENSFKQLNIHLPHDPAIPLPGFYPREGRAHIRSQTCTQTLIAALFVTDRNQRNPEVPQRVKE